MGEDGKFPKLSIQPYFAPQSNSALKIYVAFCPDWIWIAQIFRNQAHQYSMDHHYALLVCDATAGGSCIVLGGMPRDPTPARHASAVVCKMDCSGDDDDDDDDVVVVVVVVLVVLVVALAGLVVVPVSCWRWCFCVSTLPHQEANRWDLNPGGAMAWENCQRWSRNRI